MVDLIACLVSSSFFPAQNGIRPESVLLLSVIFENDPHLFDFVVFLLIITDLIIEKLAHSSVVFLTGIDVRLKSTLFHLLLIHLSLQLLNFFAHQLLTVPGLLLHLLIL